VSGGDDHQVRAAWSRLQPADWQGRPLETALLQSDIDSQWGEGGALAVYELLTLACPEIMAENT
jgi:hypothetical protein